MEASQCLFFAEVMLICGRVRLRSSKFRWFSKDGNHPNIFSSRNEDLVMKITGMRPRTSTKIVRVFNRRTLVTKKNACCHNWILRTSLCFSPQDASHVDRPGNADEADTPRITISRGNRKPALCRKTLFNRIC